MNSFTIRDIENLSGIKAHTLRVWEQRYGIIQPMRKVSNHRLYGLEDLKQILRISYLYSQGYKISRIAEMNPGDIKKLALEFGPRSGHEVFINQLMESSIDFDEVQFKRTVDNSFSNLGVEKAVVQVIYPFLNKIGMLWLTGHIIPSQEHFASNIIRNRLLVAIDQLPSDKKSNKRYLLFNPPGEFHEIPLLYTQYCLKLRGIPNILFGINTSIDQLKEFIDKNACTHFFLFLTTNFTQHSPEQFLDELEKEFPNLKIEITGSCFRNVDLKPRGNISFYRTVHEFLAQLEH